MPPNYDEFFARIKGEETTPPMPAATTAPQESGGLGEKLERVAAKSLDKADELLGLPLDPSDGATFGPTLRAQTAVVGHALNTQLRADEVKLRKERPDRMPDIMEKIRKYEKLVPPIDAAPLQDGGDDGPPRK